MEWTELHDALEQILQHECGVARKLLENMKLEEQFMLKQEHRYWHNLSREREELVILLGKMRKDREAILSKIAHFHNLSSQSLDNLLPPNEAGGWGVSLLREQMALLMGKITAQAGYNHRLALTLNIPLPIQSRQHPRTRVTTLPQDEDHSA